jgi:membrane protein YqaA with SNARE-associated domain
MTATTECPAPAAPRPAGLYTLALAWGLAEATFFFLVPDVLLTRIALRDLRHSLIAALFATAGALLGGAALWVAAQQGATVPLLKFYDYLPGISREMLGETARAINQQGVMALFGGAWRLQPFKLFAVHAGAQNVPLGLFLVASLFARLMRFAITSVAAWFIGRQLTFLPEQRRFAMHTLAWAVFYGVYFALVH